MALNGITFVTLNGGLGRVLAGDDSTSGLLLPNLAGVADIAQVVYSITEAETAGITVTAAPEAHFIIASFFEQVAAPLYVMTTTSNDYAADVEAIQSLADGEIRQLGVLAYDNFDIADIVVLDTAAKAQKADNRGLSVIYAGAVLVTNGTPQYTISTLPSLITGTHEQVSVVASLDATSGFTCLGATLGTVAFAKVSDNIGYVRKFNVVKNTAFDTLKFFTGEDYRTITSAQLSTLKGKGYIFLRKYTGFSGSFHTDSNTATLPTSDYAYIENVRTVEKAVRGLRVSLLPELMSPLETKAGKLSVPTIAKFELLCTNVLDAMKNAKEVSEYAIFIDANQNVLTTSELKIEIGITPLGVARMIKVFVGFQL